MYNSSPLKPVGKFHVQPGTQYVQLTNPRDGKKYKVEFVVVRDKMLRSISLGAEPLNK